MASKEKNFITDGLSNEDIIITISKIITRNKEDELKKLEDMKKYELLKTEFSFFSERYPMLFELAIRDDQDFNWTNLTYMLNMRNKIINDELTPENASKIVGNEWFNKYVDINSIPVNKKPKK
jgi:hypothetical protein